MEIEILQLLDGAKSATGLTVVIDVFRAFTTACYIYNQGVTRVFPVADIDTAYSLKEKNPEFLLVGERNEKKPAGFDFGNSPSLLSGFDFTGKTVVHTTSSGTQGIENAKSASEIITGSFVNAGAIVRYIKKRNPSKVSLVCMGYACEYPTDEDTLCAEYIRDKVLGSEPRFDEMVKKIKSGTGARFFDPEKQDWSPENDFWLCLQPNKFDFVLKVEKENNLNYLVKTS